MNVNTATDPAPRRVYQSERYGATGFFYTATGLGTGACTVRLHFAETIRTGINQRKFGVRLGNTPVIGGFNNTFDIYAEAVPTRRWSRSSPQLPIVAAS